MSTGTDRSGACLRNVLAVILLIGVALVILILWIPSAREAARRNQCSDNLRQIVTALASYHDAYKMFPMGAMHSGPNPGGEPPITAGLGPSWWFGIMPFVEPSSDSDAELDKQVYADIVASQRPGGDAHYEFCADDIKRYETGRSERTFTGQRGGTFQLIMLSGLWYMRCASSPLPYCETSVGPISLPSYVGIAGGCDIDPNSSDYKVSGNALAGLMAPETARVYQNKFKGTGAAAGGIVTPSGLLPPCQHVKVRDCTDGTSNTMIVAEQSEWLRDRDPAKSDRYNGHPGWTCDRASHDYRGTGSGGGWLSGTRRVDPVPQVDTPGGPPAAWGADCWNITTVRYPPNLKRVMTDEGWGDPKPLPGCSENHGINNPLQSPHAGGLLVGMADGSVQFISEKTALEVLLRMAIRDDGQRAKPED